MSSQIKLTFNATSLKVRCELTSEDVRASESPPPDILARARAKMEVVKKSGVIEYYKTYEDHLDTVWKKLRSISLSKAVTLTIASGAPDLPGVSVLPSKDGLFAITIDSAKAHPNTWRYEWFKLQILRKAGTLKEEPSNAHIFTAYCRAKLGLEVQGHLVTSIQHLKDNPKPYSIIGRRAELQVIVVIRNLSDLQSKLNRDAMMKLVRQAALQMTTPSIKFTVLEKDLQTMLDNAMAGQEQFGVGMPLVCLAALGKTVVATAHYPGAGRIAFAVSEDKMLARIVNFQINYYWEKGAPVSLEWLEKEMEHCGLKAKMTEDLRKILHDSITAQVNLNGLVVARGSLGTPPGEPYLHHVYKEAAGRISSDLDSDLINIRDLQQRDLVKAGQLIAEIRYKVPGMPGLDVYGKETKPPSTEQELIVRVGEGVQKQGTRQYIAAYDGIPQIEENDIALTKILIHEGDVNLKTGNIYFDGPIEIRGTIDQGAVVEGSEDITVTGAILNAKVIAQGNLIVKGGITSNDQGMIDVKGDLVAEFIEGGTIVAASNIYVEKAILNTKIFCGGHIKITNNDGILGGGIIHCNGSIFTPYLGFKQGARTQLTVGGNWIAERSRILKKKRLDWLKALSETERLKLRELVQRRTNQASKKTEDLKEVIQDRVVRLSKLIETQKNLLSRIQTTQNLSARVYIPKIIYTTTDLEMSGQKVKLTTELANVAIFSRKIKDSYFCDLDDLPEDEKQSYSMLQQKNYK